jgi:NitT/TauT family transport system permease protein
MAGAEHVFGESNTETRGFGWADAIVLVGLAVVLYIGVRLGFGAPAIIRGPKISLSPAALPIYAVFSTSRMLIAYLLALAFSIAYGYVAAYNRQAEQVLMPLLDVLQSVPILSFLPLVLLSFTAFLPENLAVELASIVLIFTSQAWNLTFAWYQSLTTIPNELREASTNFRFNRFMRLKTLELPFSANGMIWNSMMSWAGGWFFLMAAEIFTVGRRDFRLPGLGAYLSEAAQQGNTAALVYGLFTLVAVIVMLDQFAWRPLLVWSERFRIEMVERENPPTSWFYDVLHRSRLVAFVRSRVVAPVTRAATRALVRPAPERVSRASDGLVVRAVRQIMRVLLGLVLLYGAYRAIGMLLEVPVAGWRDIVFGLLATFARVVLALAIALLWTIPAGLLIGTNERAARFLQPVVQVVASIPATALFPVFVAALAAVAGGLNMAAVLVMLMGAQWYLLFNVIAGASGIPQDLKYSASLIGLRGRLRWRTLLLPALFPFAVTGAITASGGAWNASIVAEQIQFGGQTLSVVGIGSLIASATAQGNYPLLLAATLSMIAVVVLLNRVFWRPLYRLAEGRYRME